MLIEELKVKANQEEIVKRIEAIKEDDVFGEYLPALIAYLDFQHAKPFLKDGSTAKEWAADGCYGDEKLQEEVVHYLDWWGQKVEDGRGISVHRGRAQMVNRLFLAGLPIWREIGIDYEEGIDGGWYQEDAYNKVADIFSYPHKIGYREEEEEK